MGQARQQAGLHAAIGGMVEQPAQQLQQQHLEQAIGQQALAAGMSRSAFAAEFRAALGTTPGAYLLAWRVSLAQGLLRRGLQVRQISDQLGYASPAAFTRAFAQAVGTAPREWLKGL